MTAIKGWILLKWSRFIPPGAGSLGGGRYVIKWVTVLVEWCSCMMLRRDWPSQSSQVKVTSDSLGRQMERSTGQVGVSRLVWWCYEKDTLCRQASLLLVNLWFIKGLGWWWLRWRVQLLWVAWGFTSCWQLWPSSWREQSLKCSPFVTCYERQFYRRPILALFEPLKSHLKTKWQGRNSS